MVAAAIVGAAAVGAVASSSSSSKAANAQTDAANQANATSQEQYNQTRADQTPWREAGIGALNQLNSGIAPGGSLVRKFGVSDFTADPGYDFRMAEGMKGINNSAAARGGVLSGAALKAASKYNQNFASNEYGNSYNRFQTDQGNQFNRLASIAGVGQTATNQVAAAGQNMANQVSSNQLGAGNARASGYIGQSNAITGGMSSAYNAYQGNQLMNGLTNRNTASGGGSTTGTSWSPYGSGVSDSTGYDGYTFLE